MTTCAAAGRRHQADLGIHLCTTHFDELARWLWDIQSEWERLDARPSLQINWSEGRATSLASHQTSARVAVLALVDPRRVPITDLTTLAGLDDTLSVFDTLHDYASRIRDGRQIRLPGRWVTEQVWLGPVCRSCQHYSCRVMVSRYFSPERLTTASERKILSTHLEWAAAQSWIGAMWKDIRKLRNQLQAANGTGELRVGNCPDCGARLHLIEPTYSSRPIAGGKPLWAAECDDDANHRWEGAQLIKLRLELDQGERR